MELRRFDDATSTAWEVRQHAQVVATASVRPAAEPRAKFLRLEVAPEHRGQGIGSWLLETVMGEMRAEGVGTLEAIVITGSEADRFAARHRAVIGDHLVDDVLDLTRVDRARLHHLAQSLPDRYVLHHWLGSTPASLLDTYARARNAISDAPNRFPPPTPQWTPAAVRKAEQDHARRNESLWVTAATLDGQVVAFTEAVTTGASQAEQHDTAVLPANRRLGLARAVKADLILRLCEKRPDLRSLAVTYALSNTGMKTVNRELGFREHQRRDLVRLSLSTDS